MSILAFMRSDDTASMPAREPAPCGEEAAHGARVAAYIGAQIATAGGWISFEEYMNLALYAPGLGYYSAGAIKLGAGGDFTTAPEVSRLFGRCVAGQCARVMAGFDDPIIMEIGAGTGRLAVDMLDAMQALGQLPRQYWILEISADLRERQQRLIAVHLPHLLARVVWLDTLPAEPFRGVILANEVLDALPVRRFQWHAHAMYELGVVTSDKGFDWEARAASEPFAAHCRELAGVPLRGWPDGYVSESCTRLAEWTAGVTRALHTGAVFWFDYGLPRDHYYIPERRDGTLLCHYRQRAYADPFLYPGLQDITAWVDFTALAHSGERCGFEIAAYSTQGLFLAASGIDRQMQELAGEDQQVFAQLADQAKQLMLPGEMGERFKVMVWTRNVQIAADALALRDLRHSL